MLKHVYNTFGKICVDPVFRQTRQCLENHNPWVKSWFVTKQTVFKNYPVVIWSICLFSFLNSAPQITLKAQCLHLLQRLSINLYVWKHCMAFPSLRRLELLGHLVGLNPSNQCLLSMVCVYVHMSCICIYFQGQYVAWTTEACLRFWSKTLDFS